MYMKITEEQVRTIDMNNMKAKAIIDALSNDVMGGEIDLDIVALLDVVNDYLEANNKIFNAVL